MIIEFVVESVFTIIEALLFPFEVFFVDGTFSFLESCTTVLRLILYILPAGTIMQVLKVVLAIQSFKVGVALTKLILEIIPG